MNWRTLGLVLFVTGMVAFPAAAQTAAAAPAAAPATEWVRTGMTEYEHIEAGANEEGFWIRMEKWYTVALFLPQDRISGVLEPFRAATLEDAVKMDGLGKAVIEGPVAREIELTMTRDVTAKQLRADFNERLGKQVRVSSREMAAFNKCLQSDLAEGDTVKIALSAAGGMTITSGGKTCPEIVSQKLVNALLGLWIGYDGSPKSADQMAELFADVRPLLEQGTPPAVPAEAIATPAPPPPPPPAPAPPPADVKPAKAAAAGEPPKAAANPANPAGLIVCRSESLREVNMVVPEGGLEEIYGLMAQLGFAKRDCRFKPNE